MKIAVTGASGHIGLNLIAKLTALGHEVRALYHHPQSAIRLSTWDVEQVAIDVCDPKTLEHVFTGCEAVFHLAAKISVNPEDAAEVFKVNAQGTQHVLNAASAQGVRRFVHVSSVHALNRFPKNQRFDDARPLATDDRHSAYDRAKAQAESYVDEAVADGLDAVIVRPVGVIGPLDLGDSLIGQALLGMYREEMLASVAGGFNWVHSDDVVDMLIAGLHHGRTGERYLIAGTWTSVTAMTQYVAKITGSKSPKFTCPLGLAKISLPIQQVIWRITQKTPLYTQESLRMLDSFLDIDDSKARHELGHNPRPVESAIYDFFSYLNSKGKLNKNTQIKPIEVTHV